MVSFAKGSTMLLSLIHGFKNAGFCLSTQAVVGLLSLHLGYHVGLLAYRCKSGARGESNSI